MRITNSMMVNKFLTDSNEALNRVSKYQSQVDSTKRISSIADDPQATSKTLRARNMLSNLDLYQSNISTASSYLTEAESATSSLNEIVQAAYDDIMSAQSGSKTQAELNILAEDMKNLQNEIFSISNNTIGSSYLFGGYNYTGTTNGVTKTPPFSLDGVGHLIYNGIDLSQYSWKDEITNYVGDGTAANTGIMANLAKTVTDIAAAYDPATYTDEFAKSKASAAAEALNDFVKIGNAALNAAREFGIDTTDPLNVGYQTLDVFINGPGGISDISDALNQEISYELTATDPANQFSKTRVDDILNNNSPNLATLLDSVAGSPMDTALTDFRNIPPILNLDQSLVDAEAIKQTKVQIGPSPSQTVDITLTGLDLLGTGADNLYHLFGKCVSMLKGETSADGLPSMITSLQNAQSSILALETKIGSTQNRLTMTSNRYDNSNLNYTKMRSDAEDADMAESIINLTTAQTVYNAALAGGAELIKTSLIDFLR